MSEKKLPTGRLARLTRLASIGARTGASLLVSRDGKAAAEHAADVLGSMRGLAAKVGQMASYVDGIVPEAHRDAYERALKGLRSAAPTSSPDAIRQLVEAELGAPIDKLFAEWSVQPIASASIGQVHRARLHDGREVAVKAQHPGIERAIETDLTNAGMLEGMVSMLGPRALNSKQVYEEIATRFREELDYTLEAHRQRAFAEIHRGDPYIRIPEVIAECSTKRVLTTQLVRGRSLEEASEASPELRKLYAEVLWRFVYKANLVGGLFNADPHPGNYLFGDNGEIAFLDFGCVQPIPEARVAEARRLHSAARRGDVKAFEDSARQLLFTRGGPYEKAAIAYVRRCFAPLLSSPFHITRTYATEVVQGVYDLKQHVLHESFVPLPSGMIFMTRLQFGFYSVLARLDVPADYAGVEAIVFAEAGLE
jgi:predicted unusual protein kinase regulating ubiquinone biosynthesis (AarF/ABC1/UbiB family)